MDTFFLTVAAAVSATALLAHGVLLLNDGAYGDSVILAGMLEPGRVQHLLTSSSQVGRPLIGRVLASTMGVRNKALFYHAIAVASMVLIGTLTYLICLATGMLDAQTSAVVALLTVSYTGNQMLMDFSVALLYYFFQVFFLAGALVVFLAASADPAGAALLCVLAAGLFFLGFQMESHLSYFFGLPLLLCAGWVLARGQGQASLQPLVVAGVVSVFPFAHWILKERMTPRHGEYRNYNRFRFNPVLTRRYILRLFTRGLAGAVLEPFRYVLGHRWGWLALVPAGLAAWAFHVSGLAAAAPTVGTSLGLLCFGFVLLVLGNVPYILVLQPAGLRGWSTKNNVLIALPCALMLTGLLTLVVPGRALSALLGFTLTFYVVYLNLVHLHWVAIWAKHRSLLHALSRMPEAQAVSVFAYTDRHRLSATYDEHQENCNLYIVFLLDVLWGGLRHMAIVEPAPKTEGYTRLEVEIVMQSTTMDYVLGAVDRDGTQAALVLDAGELALSPTAVALRYLWHRWVAPEGMDGFLGALSRVTCTPLAAPQQADGPRPWSPGVAAYVERWKHVAEEALGLRAQARG